jgi:hypothetical protein
MVFECSPKNRGVYERPLLLIRMRADVLLASSLLRFAYFCFRIVYFDDADTKDSAIKNKQVKNCKKN